MSIVDQYPQAEALWAQLELCEQREDEIALLSIVDKQAAENERLKGHVKENVELLQLLQEARSEIERLKSECDHAHKSIQGLIEGAAKDAAEIEHWKKRREGLEAFIRQIIIANNEKIDSMCKGKEFCYEHKKWQEDFQSSDKECPWCPRQLRIKL